MPFDELEQDQDETAMQPWRFGYRLPDEEGSESQPSIGMRIMQMATPQAQSDAPGPLRGIDALQQAAQGDPQPEPRLSIGQRIMQIGRQGVPPFDIQDGRPVWRQDPQTQQKPSIGQRIVRGASSETQASMPSTGYDLSSWETRPGMFANAGQSKTFMPQPVQGFSLLNSSRLEPSGQIYQHPELMSSLAAEADKDTVEEPAASSARTSKESSAKGGGPEFLRGPLDFNEFASFVGGAKRGNSDPGNPSFLNSYDAQPPEQEGKTLAESFGRSVGAMAGAGTVGAAIGSEGQLSQARQPINQKPPVKGSVGKGGENDPARVKAIQHLLNEEIEVGQLVGSPLEENGQTSDVMLRLIETYQKAHKIPREGLLTEKSLTIKNLKENRLENSSWDGYDNTIKREVDSFNQSIKQKYPDFPGLDWRLVKAMLWQESGGPNTGKEWKTWPMQIGRRKSDLAIEDVIGGGYHTNLISLKPVRDEIARAYRQHKMTPTLNIRAAVIYLCARAIHGFDAEKNAPQLKDRLEEGQSLSKFAEEHETTVENLEMLNPTIKGKEKSLQPGKLIYQKTKPVWSPWEWAVHNYNSEKTDPNYVKKVLRYYEAIKKRWSQDSTVRQH